MANKPRVNLIYLRKEEEDKIRDSLKRDGECFLDSIGKLSVIDIPPRKRFHFGKQTTTHFPKSKRVVFQASKSLKNSVL